MDQYDKEIIKKIKQIKSRHFFDQSFLLDAQETKRLTFANRLLDGFFTQTIYLIQTDQISHDEFERNCVEFVECFDNFKLSIILKKKYLEVVKSALEESRVALNYKFTHPVLIKLLSANQEANTEDNSRFSGLEEIIANLNEVKKSNAFNQVNYELPIARIDLNIRIQSVINSYIDQLIQELENNNLSYFVYSSISTGTSDNIEDTELMMDLDSEDKEEFQKIFYKVSSFLNRKNLIEF